jgi:hypothetical protein
MWGKNKTTCDRWELQKARVSFAMKILTVFVSFSNRAPVANRFFRAPATRARKTHVIYVERIADRIEKNERRCPSSDNVTHTPRSSRTSNKGIRQNTRITHKSLLYTRHHTTCVYPCPYEGKRARRFVRGVNMVHVLY